MKNVDLGLLVLRAGAGLMMMSHGYGKVLRVIEGNFQFADPLGIGPGASLILAALAEFFCALAVVIGFKVRWASIPVVITMLVAAFAYHGGDPWAEKEKALLFALVFLALVFTGGGRYGLGSRSRGRRSR